MKRLAMITAAALLAVGYLPLSTVDAEAADHKPEKSEKAERSGNSGLGNLNAAHASANARLHASPNSMVGRIALYEKVERYRLCEAAAADDCAAELEGLSEEEIGQVEDGTLTADMVLIEAANKPVSEEPDGEVLLETVRSAVNRLLGIAEPVAEPAPVEEAGVTE